MRFPQVIVIAVLLTLFGLGGRAISVGIAADAESSDEVTSNEPHILRIAVEYSQYQKITPEPVRVSLFVSGQCVYFRGTRERQIEENIKKYGPHASAAILVYMNEPAAESFKDIADGYPVGSVIAKEKVADIAPANFYSNSTDTEEEKPNAVGGMVKREPGYDPENGDWEYFYFEDPAEVYSGRIASCVECHAGARDTDHVFGTWLNAGTAIESGIRAP